MSYRRRVMSAGQLSRGRQSTFCFRRDRLKAAGVSTAGWYLSESLFPDVNLFPG